MKTTYRAMQISASGKLELVERPTPVPGDNEVLIAVEVCGVCGADASDIDRADRALQPPRVPGHEVVGRIVALGPHAPSIWKRGQRVGVGRLGGHCNECSECRRGRFNLCRNQPVLGSSCDGGYADMMIAPATGLVSIPGELSSEEAAPILCAGIATFNALKKSGAEAGDTVAILGVGGLGHMALQYARNMGFRVVAVGRGEDIARDAIALGAHRYIDTNKENASEALNTLGGARAILTTIASPDAVAALIPGLAPAGRLVVLGVGEDPLPVSSGYLVGAERGVIGSITGSPFENEKALAFSVLAGVRPMIETMPLERAQEAVERMRSGDAKFRIVLTMGDRSNAHQ
ncbi:alcohol dehydrogenase catalytic domain-containing protein [Ciceribacter thiooxidans]|uniref:Alcohol dehydrogenase catalytic domain-containing protein n=1 Tax=Ciceribacter thiooxidans TaxID=1969821 RepID=A0ABV7I8R1_9HYPH|nr:alcohol dehydrogenase catalytic domain-containing protein [Ciceribacter thiooxidans]